MQRDLRALADTSFDLVVIGGGLFGAFAAWDAALRGLSVALIERGDVGGATSANSFKIVHGGIRYLQHADVYRIRQSSSERRALLRIAPHLVRPLPIVIPTHGSGLSGRAALRAGLAAYDLLTPDRNSGLPDPARRIPPGRMWSRATLLERYRDLVRPDVTGAGVFTDGQFTNPPRLVLAVARSAAAAGAIVGSYVEATGFLRRGDAVTGVVARDCLGGGDFEVRAQTVVNAAGPYAETLLTRSGFPLPSPGTYSRDACFVVPRRLLPDDHALAILGRTRDPDARLSRGARHLFIAPWRDYTLVGTWHRVQQPGSLDIHVTDDHLAGFLDEVNHSAPGLNLHLADISASYSGLVPFGENPSGAEDLRYGHRSQLIDHARVHGCANLVTLIGVRLTTARFEAERAIDLVFRKRTRRSPPCRTAITPVQGGDISDTEALAGNAERETDHRVPAQVARQLVGNYGTEFRGLLAEEGERPLDTIGDSTTIRAQVYRAVRSEAALTLEDVILRRTDLGSGAYPGREALEECGVIMASQLGWTSADVDRQLAAVEAKFPPWEVARRPAARPPKGVTCV